MCYCEDQKQIIAHTLCNKISVYEMWKRIHRKCLRSKQNIFINKPLKNPVYLRDPNVIINVPTNVLEPYSTKPSEEYKVFHCFYAIGSIIGATESPPGTPFTNMEWH